MKKIDIIGIAFGNFKRRKTRSILTVLGVVIGTASIVTMMSLGIAMNVAFSDQMKQMGDLTTVVVMGGGYDGGGKGAEQKSMNDDAVKEFETIKNVNVVSPELRISGKVVAGKYMNYANIVGINSDYMKKLGMEAEQGTLLNKKEHISSGKKIYCVYGSEVPYQFYNPKDRSNGGGMMGGVMMGSGMGDEEREPPSVDVMNETKKIKFTFDQSYGEKRPGMGDVSQTVKKPKFYIMKTAGVLKESYSESSYTIYIDMDTARRMKKEQDKFNKSMENAASGGMLSGSNKKDPNVYSQIKVVTDNLEHTMQVTNEIKNMGYSAYSSAEWITQAQEQTKILQMFLAGIGGVSLLVAAIGITNTMIMSIYERTREIGIMKVIGCYLKDIRSMFLTEAGFIGLFGGIIGVGLSGGISLLLNSLTKNGGDMFPPGTRLSVIPWWLALSAIGFAILIGLISGFLPARRAMRLSALEAMSN